MSDFRPAPRARLDWANIVFWCGVAPLVAGGTSYGLYRLGLVLCHHMHAPRALGILARLLWG